MTRGTGRERGLGARWWHRLRWLVPSFLCITLLVFLVVRLAPGDPAEALLGASSESASQLSSSEREALVAQFQAQHLLDQPLLVQYLDFLGPLQFGPQGHRWFGGSGARAYGGLLLLDFGREYARPSVDVAAELARRLCVTVPLALSSILLAYALAIPLGFYTALRRGRALERLSSALLFLLHSVPAFWAALLLIMAFGASGLSCLPVLGLRSVEAASMGSFERLWDLVQHAILPIVCLTYGSLAYLARQTRSGVLEVLQADFVRAARAQGQSEARLLWRHVLPNALVPLVALGGSILPALVGGSVIVERIFSLQGMGSYAYEGLLARDYNVVQACTALAALMTLLGLWISDGLCARLDPRLGDG